MQYNTVKLGDICTITKGAIGIMKAIPGEYQMITLGETNKTHTEYQFDAKAVIVPLVSSTGHGHASMKQVKYFEGKFALGNILCAVIPKDDNVVLAKYLHIYLHWNRNELLVSQMKGMANVSLPMNRIADVIINLPDIETQKRIIEKVKTLQLRIETLQSELVAQLTLIDRLDQSILQEAMSGELKIEREKCKKEETGQQLLQRILFVKEKLIKEKKLKAGKLSGQSKSFIDEYTIPNNWVWCKLDDLLFITKLAGFEFTKHIHLTEQGEIPVIRAQNVRPYKIDKTNLLYIDKTTSLLLDRCSLVKKCLLITFIGAGIGDIATFSEIERWHLAPNVAKAEPFDNCEDLISVEYINYYLMSKIGQREIFKSMKATAQPCLSMATIRDIDVPLPPLPAQKYIVSEIERQLVITKLLRQEVKQNQVKVENLLQSELQKVFNT